MRKRYLVAAEDTENTGSTIDPIEMIPRRFLPPLRNP